MLRSNVVYKKRFDYPEFWTIGGEDMTTKIDSRVEQAETTDVLRTEVRSPVDGATLGTVTNAGPADVASAIAKAASAAVEFAALPAHRRAALLRQAAVAVDEQRDALVDDLVRGLGKPVRFARAEANRGSDMLLRCAEELSSLGGETLPLDAVPGGEGRTGMTWREPLGVIAAVTPFNAPVNLTLQKVAPALAMGNTVIVKPSPEAALVVERLVGAISSVLPDGVLQVLHGGPEVVLGLSRDPRVDAVSLTGGTVAGEAVLREAGIKPVLLELGSNAPNIVLADADIADAATRITGAAFGASGQQCISAQRILVERSAHDEFLAAFLAAARGLVVGDPAETTTDLGPMIHRRSRDRVVELVDDAEARGGRIALDGRTDSLYLGPTVVTDPHPDSRLLREEVFGPVVVVQSVDDLDDALAVANSVDVGLQAACFTRDLDRAFAAARGLRAGSVWINEATRFRLDTYPFGGVGRSGLGREGVRYAMEELSTLKFVGLRHN
ncbi:aldehyde dehydrogenase family protein [Amycolatopsis methanolica]|uniref:aldehyde dehydrogenase family protein n=1 Tax=Amycolatopsis methanolica TaxID=1814 RepID=UPI00341FD463